jgi:hypothetical protein
MMSQKYGKSRKISTIIGAIIITILFISTVTAVPQVQGNALMDKINEKEKFESFASLLKQGNEKPIENLELINLLRSCFYSTDELALNNENLDDIGTQDLNSFLQALIELIINFIRDNIINGDGQTPDIENGLLNIIISVLKTLFTIPIILLQILFSTSVGIINGLIRMATSIFTIFLLIIGGIQTALTLGSILLLFIGLMSKIGIKALVVMGAPIFALIAAQIAISIGSLLGGISVTIFSVLAMLLFLALPISIIGGILYLLNPDGLESGTGFDLNFNTDRTGIIYMLLSILSTKFN